MKHNMPPPGGGGKQNCLISCIWGIKNIVMQENLLVLVKKFEVFNHLMIQAFVANLNNYFA